MQALNKMKSWHSIDARKTDILLKNSIPKSEFIFSLLILEKILDLKLPAPRSLSNLGCDIVETMSNITDLLNYLNSIKNDKKFSSLYRSG